MPSRQSTIEHVQATNQAITRVVFITDASFRADHYISSENFFHLKAFITREKERRILAAGDQPENAGTGELYRGTTGELHTHQKI